MKFYLWFSVLLCGSTVLSGCVASPDRERLEAFIDDHVARVEPLSAKANRTYFTATTTGDEEAYGLYSELQLQIRKIYNNHDDFALLKELRESNTIHDRRLRRQLDKLYYAYLPNQIEPDLLERIVALDTSIQETYGNFRGKIDGDELTMSDIYTIMTTEGNTRRREMAYKASKQVGDVIAADLIQLVKLRNVAAREVGFDNFHTLTVTAGEQSVEQLDQIFAQLCERTDEPYARMKAELDEVLAADYGIKVEKLMPWHYHDPFFQRTPLVYDYDLDVYYSEKDVKTLAADYYRGIGLSVDDILARSDLYDKPGKYPHAYSQDVDRSGDVRILCNLQNTERWMETILHELGHAVYSKYHDRSEPWLLREPAHSFTTEAIAMFFGRLSRNPVWMQRMLGLSEQQRAEIEDVSRKYLRFQQVLFARWALVMYNFEKSLYADPDQDLNNLWWDLVEKYQYVNRPPGPANAGWASKLHFVVAPCYYHNYMLGELLASQLHHHIVSDVLKTDSDREVGYVGDKRVGAFLRTEVLEPGALYEWNDMIARATGEPLTPKYFVEQFVQ